MRQFLMGLIIVSLAVITGFVVYEGVGCRVLAGQPTLATKEAPSKVAPVPAKPVQTPDQAKPDQVVEGSACDCNRVVRSVVVRSCPCTVVTRQVQVERQVVVRQPRVVTRRCKTGCQCTSCAKQVVEKVIVEKPRVARHRCTNKTGCGCGCQTKVDVKVRVH
jgi:hypothetical protein